MPELRVDPLSGQRAIVARDRAGRPGGGLSVAPPPAIDPESDPFAEGHEDRTPPELYAVRPNGGGAGHAGLDGAGRAEPVSGAGRGLRAARARMPIQTCSGRPPPAAPTR